MRHATLVHLYFKTENTCEIESYDQPGNKIRTRATQSVADPLA